MAVVTEKTAWPEQQFPVFTLGQLAQMGEDLQEPGSQYLFRGQGDASWSLEPRLLREIRDAGIGAAAAIHLESDLRQQFEAQAHLYLEPSVLEEDDFLAWWALIQHHHGPTRLLDWTKSPLVALYFAVLDQPLKDGAVWYFNATRMRAAMKKQMPEYFDTISPNVEALEEICRKTDAPEALYTIQRVRQTSRMIAQQGKFTLCTQVLSDHAQVIAKALTGEGKKSFGRWRIEPGAKTRLLSALRMVNITASSLFPGIDGVGRSLQESVRSITQPTGGQEQPGSEPSC